LQTEAEREHIAEEREDLAAERERLARERANRKADHSPEAG
jgi:hypothetical protein